MSSIFVNCVWLFHEVFSPDTAYFVDWKSNTDRPGQSAVVYMSEAPVVML